MYIMVALNFILSYYILMKDRVVINGGIEQKALSDLPMSFCKLINLHYINKDCIFFFHTFMDLGALKFKKIR